jgi:hypothetical protein
MSVHRILLQPLVLTRHISLLNAIQSCVQDITNAYLISVQDRRIQRLLNSGLKLYAKLSKSMVYMKMISGTLMRLALQWGSV